MVFKEIKKWKSMTKSRGVANERNEKKYRRREVPIMYRCSGCCTQYWIVWKLEF
jgi:hypothetical protein